MTKMKTYLDPEEINDLEATGTNMRDRLLIRLLFHLGCRVSEVISITVDDINVDTGMITIQHLKTRLRLSCPACSTRLGRNHSFCPGCGLRMEKAIGEAKEHRKVRTLPLHKDSLQMLEDYIKRGGPVKKNNKLFIFGINRHRAWQIVRDCANRAGLPKLVNPESGKLRGVSPHRLRDSLATHAVKLDDSGDGLRLLQEHLGHASFNTTAKYRKVAGEEHKAWYEKLWLKGEGKKQNVPAP